jgi:hypothetical protein
VPSGERAIAYGLYSPRATTVLCPVTGSTRTMRPALFSATSSEPLGSSSIEVGQAKVAGGGAAPRNVAATSSNAHEAGNLGTVCWDGGTPVSFAKIEP